MHYVLWKHCWCGVAIHVTVRTNLTVDNNTFFSVIVVSPGTYIKSLAIQGRADDGVTGTPVGDWLAGQRDGFDVISCLGESADTITYHSNEQNSHVTVKWTPSEDHGLIWFMWVLDCTFHHNKHDLYLHLLGHYLSGGEGSGNHGNLVTRRGVMYIFLVNYWEKNIIIKSLIWENWVILIVCPKCHHMQLGAHISPLFSNINNILAHISQIQTKILL